MMTDKEAQKSRLSGISPALKLCVSLYCIINCAASNNVVTSTATLIIMSFAVCFFGGLRFSRLLRFYAIPLFFAVTGSAALMFEPGSSGAVISFFDVSITRPGLIGASEMLMRCMGAVSAAFFLSLTTPAHAVFAVLYGAPLPSFITETAELIYRYIFVLHGSYKKIYVAQMSRLGYSNLKASYRSTALIGAAVFIKAVNTAKRAGAALECRGCEGSVKALKRKYETKPAHILLSVVLCAFLTCTGVIF